MASDSEKPSSSANETSLNAASALEILQNLASDGRLNEVDATTLQDFRQTLGQESPKAIFKGVVENRWKISPAGWKHILYTGSIAAVPLLYRDWQAMTPEGSEAVLAKLSEYWQVLLGVMGSVAGFEAWRKDR